MNKPTRPHVSPDAAKQTAQPQPRQPGAQPVAPPIYRPQPTPYVLQRKTAQAPAPPAGAKNHPPRPCAPPAYRPQPAPRVLQRKTATSGPAAPPVYRPQPTPKILQPKLATTPPPAARQARPAVPAPPTQHQRPGPNVLQPKRAAGRPAQADKSPRPSAPQPVRRSATPNAVQLKSAAAPREARLPGRAAGTIQLLATADLAGALNNINYLNNTSFPGVINDMTAYRTHIVNELNNYQVNNGVANPPANHELSYAAEGLLRFSERMIEAADGGYNEIGEAVRLINKMNPIDVPILGQPGQHPDLWYNKNGGFTGIEAKAINSANVGQVNAQILAADAQLGGYNNLNRSKILIWIAHPNNQWPGVAGWLGRTTNLALRNAVANQLNGMAIPNADVITVLDVRVNYGGGMKDIQATGGNGNWVVNVL